MAHAFHKNMFALVAISQISRGLSLPRRAGLFPSQQVHLEARKGLMRHELQSEGSVATVDNGLRELEVQGSAQLVDHTPEVASHVPHDVISSSLFSFGNLGGTGDDGGNTSEPKSHWNYSQEDQPLWKNVSADCGGQAQSPIDFDTSAEYAAGNGTDTLWHRLTYKSMSGRGIANNGHNVQVDMPDAGQLKLPDGQYDLRQFHFHFPSEHTTDGRNSVGEMHMVHTRADDPTKVAVVALLFESDPQYLGGQWPTNAARAPELDFLKNIGFLPSTGGLPAAGQALVGFTANVSLMAAFAPEFQGSYFHYVGSFTTPPCTEGVHWYVMRNAAAVTDDMVATFKALFPDPNNNRPVQDLNNRSIVAGSVDIIAVTPDPDPNAIGTAADNATADAASADNATAATGGSAPTSAPNSTNATSLTGLENAVGKEMR